MKTLTRGQDFKTEKRSDLWCHAQILSSSKSHLHTCMKSQFSHLKKKKLHSGNIVPAQTSTQPPTEPHTHIWYALQSSTLVRFTCECMPITQVCFWIENTVFWERTPSSMIEVYILEGDPQTHSYRSDPETRLNGKVGDNSHSTQSGALAQCLFSMTFLESNLDYT